MLSLVTLERQTPRHGFGRTSHVLPISSYIIIHIRIMAPIRVGIVGLSSKPGAWATLAHLPRLAQSPNFQIVALCNSTLESTRAAIKAHNLPESTKAYDSYDKLAADPDVDLYVVSTRADTHYDVAMPALKAGRNVFVEWPLAATTKQAKEMAALAKQKNLKTIVGFQGRMSPSVRKVKELIDTGALGEIHSVNYQGAIHVWQNNAASDRYYYFMDRKVGGNLLTIYGGHVLDSILYAVGELKPGSYTPLAANLRPRMHLMKPDGSLSRRTLRERHAGPDPLTRTPGKKSIRRVQLPFEGRRSVHQQSRVDVEDIRHER